ncbi:hypothetical protein [Polaromonas glacialis]|uniref:hypothetical protein n=1 Tax=Polaromonas glacialis TaxID=866564 RepID=UPI00049719AC|nr:hypothetical protein [Polaromonas glacialis]
MNISPFFRNLRSAYRAEMDDLTFDSEGRDVLRQRLAEKRREIGFLLQMMELSPEMVAVVFHQGLRFTEPAVMDHLLSHESDEFPEWASLSGGIELTPWAHELAQIILKAPGGEWFLTVAAGLHYMAGKPDAALAGQGDDARYEDSDNNDNDDTDVQDDFNDHESDEVRGDARDREEAGASWLEGQGFDRKD